MKFSIRVSPRATSAAADHQVFWFTRTAGAVWG